MLIISGTPIYRLEWMNPILKTRLISGGKIVGAKQMYSYVPKVYEELEIKLKD